MKKAETLLAISIRQPWAWAILKGWKKVENRTWKPPAKAVGSRVLVHAGATKEMSGCMGGVKTVIAKYHADEIEQEVKNLGFFSDSLEEEIDYLYDTDRNTSASRGRIIGAVTITGYREAGYLGDGWEEGPVVWELEEPEIFDSPIAVTGTLGFFSPVPTDWRKE